MGILASTQSGIKKGSGHLGLLLLRLFSAFLFAYAVALIWEGLLFYGRISFWFTFVVSLMVYMRVTRAWNVGAVLVLNLILFLVGLLLRMYVLVAPGA